MEVIQEQQSTLLSYAGQIPQIEMDILMGNIRKVYELFTELNKPVPSKITAPPAHQYPQETIQPEELIATMSLTPVEEIKVAVPEPVVAETPFEPVAEVIESANASAHMQQDLHSRSPKMAVPTRTRVAPSAIAASKSPVMPIDSSRMTTLSIRS